MKKIEITIVKSTAKAHLVEDENGNKAWMQARWVKDNKVNAETFAKNAQDFKAREKFSQDQKDFRNSSHEIGSIEKETAKAVAVSATITEEHTDQQITRLAWFPKSQVTDSKAPGWLIAAKAKELIERNAMSNGGFYTVEICGHSF